MSNDMCRGLLEFLDASPSCYHAADNVAQTLLGAGYQQLWEGASWNLCEQGKYFVMRGDSSLIAFQIPKKEFRGFMIAAGHSDSPTFKVRESAEVASAGNCIRLSIEPYGGMILRSWLDRPLSVAGRAMVREENRIVSKLIHVDRDLLMIPSVAIHMDREVNKGTALKANVDMLPLYSGGKETGSFRKLIAETAGVEEGDLLTTDLYLYPRTPAARIGAHEEFVASARLDDLQCVFGCLQGFLAADAGESVPVLAVFNNEEVGSGTRQGADSDFLYSTLKRIVYAMGGNEETYMQAVAESFLISADNAHAVHPNHPEKADPTNRPVLNGGIVIKYSGNQKYTSDAFSGSVMKKLCMDADVPYQVFYNHSDVLGGSTLGNISTAHVSVASVDIGLPQLAMHSAVETAGVKDIEYLIKALKEFYKL